MEHPSGAILAGPGVFLPQLMLPAWADSPESANPKVRQSLPPHLVHTAASVNSLVFPGLPSLAKLNPGAPGWGCLQVLLSGIFMKRADTANGSSRDFLETLETFYWSCLFWAESSFFLFGLISHCTSRSLNESPVMSVPDRRAPRHSELSSSAPAVLCPVPTSHTSPTTFGMSLIRQHLTQYQASSFSTVAQTDIPAYQSNFTILASLWVHLHSQPQPGTVRI